MPELVLAVARFGVLVLLWVFVFAVVAALKRDLLGGGRQAVVAAPAGAAFPQQGRRQKSLQGKTPHTLVVVEGELTGTQIPLGETPITIGRAEDSTLVLSDDYASTRHARLVPRAGQWLLEDLGSTNGTYLERTAVTMPVAVPTGAPIRIGRTVLELRS